MRAYYYDNESGSPSEPHDSGREVDVSILKAMGVLYWSIPVDAEGKWQETIESVARERKYKNRDVVESSRAILGEKYDEVTAKFWKEYVHDSGEWTISRSLVIGIQAYAR